MSELMEEWRPVAGTRGYEVSSHGRVRREGRILKQRPSHRGYPMLYITLDSGKRMNRVVHALVMAAFVGPRPEGREIAHRDGVRHNNHLSNLRYCTPKENRADDVVNGTRAKGSRHGCAKLNEANVAIIKRRLLGGDRHKDIASAYNVSTDCITRINIGATWTHVRPA